MMSPLCPPAHTPSPPNPPPILHNSRVNPEPQPPPPPPRPEYCHFSWAQPFSCSGFFFLGSRGRGCPSGCDCRVSGSLSTAFGYIKFSFAARSLYSCPPNLIFHADLKRALHNEHHYISDTPPLRHRQERSVLRTFRYLIGEAGSEAFHAREGWTDGWMYLQR